MHQANAKYQEFLFRRRDNIFERWKQNAKKRLGIRKLGQAIALKHYLRVISKYFTLWIDDWEERKRVKRLSQKSTDMFRSLSCRWRLKHLIVHAVETQEKKELLVARAHAREMERTVLVGQRVLKLW
ncbi:hypothetical protein ADUPG1_003530, partial [Aduncisulcus paluster]